MRIPSAATTWSQSTSVESEELQRSPELGITRAAGFVLIIPNGSHQMSYGQFRWLPDDRQDTERDVAGRLGIRLLGQNTRFDRLGIDWHTSGQPFERHPDGVVYRHHCPAERHLSQNQFKCAPCHSWWQLESAHRLPLGRTKRTIRQSNCEIWATSDSNGHSGAPSRASIMASGRGCVTHKG